MKPIGKILTAMAGLSFMFVGCNDMAEIVERVDNLENRVTILESRISSLNSNIEALQVLSGETVINSVEKDEDTGTYTITLSNNEKLTITQGSMSATPVLSINADGYWTVDYNDGNGARLLDGRQIPATGKDGVTPKFNVDKDNFWIVSYDNGKTFIQVLDETGNPVSAVPEDGSVAGDSFFSEVAADNESGIFTLTLHDGKEIVLPIVPDFMCAIENNGGIQIFKGGETRTWNMLLKGVTVDDCIVSAPEGWVAFVSEDILSVTAPEQEAVTKSVIADSRTDVAVLAFCGIYSTIAKLRVQLDSEGTDINPSASVTANVSDEVDKVSFSIILKDATSFKYILRGIADEAPSVETVLSDGDSGTEEHLVISGCEEYTQYVLYLVPMYGDVYGELVSCTARSGERNWTSLYEKYQAGFDIVIGDRIYNKTEWGDARIITTDSEFKGLSATDPKVIFVSPGTTLTYASTGSANRILFIGDSPNDKSAKIVLSQFIRAKADSGIDGHLVFYNLTFDSSEWNNYVFSNNASADNVYPYIAWIGCKLKTSGEKNFTYVGGSSNGSYGEIRIQDCDWMLDKPVGTVYLIHPNTQTRDYGSIIFKNNVFYTADPTPVQIFTGKNCTLDEIVFENNTFYNIGGNTNFWIQSKSLNRMTVKNNLFYSGGSMGNNYGLYRTSNVTQTNGNIYDGHTGIKGECRNNAFYLNDPNPEYSWQIFWYGTARADVSLFTYFEEPVDLAEDPFSSGTADVVGGIFIPSAEYSVYGAIR